MLKKIDRFVMKCAPMAHPVNIALWSAEYTQITGQALVTARVVRSKAPIAWIEYVYSPGLRSLDSWIGGALRLWGAVTRKQVKTIYLVCSRSNWGFLRDVPALLTTMAGVRVVVHSHGSDIVDLLTVRPLSPLARSLYSRCEIVVPSSHLLEPLRRVTDAPLHLCENYFVSATSSDDDESLAKASPETLSVFWNSNIMASKGFFLLADAIRKLSDDGYPVRLISIGRPIGDEELSEEEAAARLAALKLMTWFEYRGSVGLDTATALMSNVDVVALPSRYRSECQPLAVIQAMCAGKAVIVSDIPALRETLGRYPARLVRAGSVPAILDALQHLLREKQSDPSAFTSSRLTAAESARRRFHIDRFDHEMMTILVGKVVLN